MLSIFDICTFQEAIETAHSTVINSGKYSHGQIRDFYRNRNKSDINYFEIDIQAETNEDIAYRKHCEQKEFYKESRYLFITNIVILCIVVVKQNCNTW